MARPSALALALAAAAGCEGLGPGDNPSELVDSTGLVFGWSCDDDRCRLAPPSLDYSLPCELVWTSVWGRFYELCMSCASPDGSASAFIAEWCRPIACEVSADCPALYWHSDQHEYECENGLCQNVDVGAFPRAPMTADDAMVLCFADLPREETLAIDAPSSRERRAMVTDACGAAPRPGTICDPPPACAIR